MMTEDFELRLELVQIELLAIKSQIELLNANLLLAQALYGKTQGE